MCIESAGDGCDGACIAHSIAISQQNLLLQLSLYDRFDARKWIWVNIELFYVRVCRLSLYPIRPLFPSNTMSIEHCLYYNIPLYRIAHTTAVFAAHFVMYIDCNSNKFAWIVWREGWIRARNQHTSFMQKHQAFNNKLQLCTVCTTIFVLLLLL